MRDRRVGRVRIGFLCVALAVPSVAQAQYSFDILREFDENLGDAVPSPGSLVQARDGNFYGLTGFTGFGGTGGSKAVFRLTPSGGFSTIHTFTGGLDGGFPGATLVPGQDGALYGTTRTGGAAGGGTIYRVSLDGQFSVLHAFDPVVEGQDIWGLIAGIDGNFYGVTSTTDSGGDQATFYRATPDGQVTRLHTFTGDPPSSRPLPVTSGDFYGLTFGRVAFRLTAAGAFSAVRQFSPAEFFRPQFLTQGSDGEIYGSDLCLGKMFRMSLSGNLTFLPAVGTECSSVLGRQSAISLTRGNDGTLLGAINSSAATIIFRMGAAGEKTVLHDFAGRFLIMDQVLQANDGRLYGVGFRLGGRPTDTAIGAIFRLNLPSPIFMGVRAGDFTGDGRADPGVFRPSTGQWFIERAATYTWGASDDVPVARDYDGDGSTDVAVFRPSTGTWYIRNFSSSVWGAAGDIPVPGDYDGDGKADIAVFRRSTNIWYILNSANGGGSTASWGGGGDIPVPADYDGDGKTDVAVFRPSTGVWYILNSSTGGGSTASWGGDGDIPVPADYDGDGKTDVGVFRPSTGTWYILNSRTATPASYAWGASGDMPVPGDYDGDGKTDIGVYRPSTGTWYFINSSTGAGGTAAWGGRDDLPI